MATMDTALHCPTCGYNLTGLPENRCPECGNSFEGKRISGQQLDRLRVRRAWLALLQLLGILAADAAAIVLLGAVLSDPWPIWLVLLTTPLNALHAARGLVRAWIWPEERPFHSYEYVDLVLAFVAVLIGQYFILGLMLALGFALLWRFL